MAATSVTTARPKSVRGRTAVATRVYGALFALSVPHMWLEYMTLKGAAEYGALLFGSAAVVQQGLVYYDLEKLDSHSAITEAEYRGFVHSPSERVLRGLIMIAILVMAGEIPCVVFSLVQLVCNHWPIGERLCCREQWSHYGFLLGAIAAFFLLGLWNLLAFCGRLRSRTESGLSISTTQDRAAAVRIIVFIVSSAIGFTYWTLYWYTDGTRVSDFALLFLMLYGITVILAIVLKLPRAVTWCVKLWLRLP